MTFFSGIVKSSLSLLGSNSPAFGYHIGDKVEFYADQSVWTLHHGTKKEDGSPVSIFVFDRNKSRDRVQLARNAFKRIRTLRHPDILRYLDGIETEQTIMFATEPVEPLSNQINQDPNPNLILWGLYKIANVLKFINNDCGMVHGNVRISSIFTNKAGEWKLGGLELLSSMSEESPIFMTFGGLVPDAQRYATPEIKKSGWNNETDSNHVDSLPIESTDSYHLGCLIYEVYNHRFESTDSLLQQKGDIPISIQRIYSQLLHISAKGRATAKMFLDEGLRPRGFFSTDFITINLFLENISVKDQSEKEEFFRQLDSTIDSFPSEFSKYKILPELINAFEFGAGGVKALNAIIKIGDHLANNEYESIIIEPIVRMFASPDRAIRIGLLENMHKFIDHMSTGMVTNQVFPNIVTGFTDTIPIIREQTIKSTLLLVPKLSERIINYDLLKYLARSQMDSEPGIRTNTTICLGKIAKHLSEGTRKKILIPAFTRSLRDSFHHARIAALMALNATSAFYDAQDCSSKVIPAIACVLIDKEKPVRDQAFKTMQTFITKIQEYADSMPDTALEPVSNPNESEVQNNGLTGVLGGATKGLAGWAVSSIQSRFVSPVGEIDRPLSSPQLIPDNHITANGVEKPVTLNSSLINLTTLDDSVGNEGWDNDSNTSVDFPLSSDNNDNTWGSPRDTFLHSSDHSLASPASSIITFSHTTKAQNPMKLGSKNKNIDLDDGMSTPSPLSFAEAVSPTTGNKSDRKAELERRREERRQRMAELREKKKSSTGARKIENADI
ncbi:armadillo-type protein [Pilobolus umbonatus]|nr:armadillo-type protein [Pilobolus umbonatus]